MNCERQQLTNHHAYILLCLWTLSGCHNNYSITLHTPGAEPLVSVGF